MAQTLRFSEVRFGSPLVELFKALLMVYFDPSLVENYGPIYLLVRPLILVQVAFAKPVKQ